MSNTLRFIGVAIMLVFYGVAREAIEFGRADKIIWFVFGVLIAYYIARTLPLEDKK